MSQSPRRARAALDALCRRFVPAAYEADPPIDVLAHVEQRIASLDSAMRRDVIGALHFFDHPVTGMFLSGRPRRFSTLPPAEQDALLREWEHSSLALRRTVFQALRRLVLTTYYSLPEAHATLEYPGPLHLRSPVVPWEGAAPGSSRDDEPVARAATPVQRAVAPLAIESAAHIAHDRALRTQVCVIGSGAGGAVVAAKLAEAGFDVIVLEEGGYYTQADFDDDEGRLAPLLYADSAARATDDLSMMMLQGRCIGGGTTVNWLMTLRPQPWVMYEWEHEHGIELLSERVLAPRLFELEETIHARPLPDDAHSPANRVILDGCARLGWHSLQARINTRNCIRAGSCGLGCRWNAKQNASTVFLPRAIEAGARVWCDARADRIDIVERAGSQLKRIHCVALDRATREPRARFTVEAPIVVLAAGAIGTPAILERSGFGGGGVGRWLRVHPTTGVLGRYGQPMFSGAGVPQSAVCSEFLRGDDGYGFWIECAPLRPGIGAAALQGFGARHRAHMLDFMHISPLIVLVRDGADRARSAGDVRVDRSGRIRVRYRLHNAERKQMIRGLQAAARLHLACNADHALTLHTDAEPIRTERDVEQIAAHHFAPNRFSLFTAHVNGTCRMGKDPQKSGATPEGERHGCKHLWIADGSLFPTAPGVNPQLTIMAVSSLIADRIIDRAR
jgi:choline dehydrogenase-like flavoprotein